MSTPFRLLLPRPIHEEMLAQALAELPNECCGLLAGRVEDGVGRVEQRYALVNALASPTRFESDGPSMFRAVQDMQTRGIDVLAVYHSHPTTDPVPSKRDLEWNFWPGVMQLIISLKDAEPLVRGWWLGEQDYRQGDWEVIE